MELLGEPVVIPASTTDEEIAAACESADVRSLLAAVAHLTGDRSLLRTDLAPDPARLIEEEAGQTPEQLALGRSLATAALVAFRDRGSVPAPPPEPAALRELLGFLVGPEVDGYLPVLVEELALDGADHRAPEWTVGAVAPGRTMRAAVVGAGMSGLVAAHRLRQAGVDVVVLDKDEELGGTWFENTYPGCRVDVPNHFYSYSFAQTGAWPSWFSAQPDLLDYFRSVADHLELRHHIRFGTEVVSLAWDAAAQRWDVTTRPKGGGDEVTEGYDVVVSAAGQLNRPSLPDIPGRDTFAGEWFHSARWDHDVDLAGKRVAVIGTGASAAQFIPAVAEAAGDLVVFQRTPAWMIPTPTYHDELPDGLRWLLRHVPGYARWDRLWLFWRAHEGLLPYAVVDPDRPDRARSVSALNEFVREMLTEYLRSEFTDPDLLDAVTPRYPPLSKRFVRDNGIWARTLARPDVTLVTTGIEAITENGVRTADGVHREVDVLVYGTGFTASQFLVPMRVTGAGGVDLHERWAGDARAYLGLTIPGFPNLFLMYGPNTNIVVNGSIIYFSELEARYLVEAVGLLAAGGHRSLSVRPEVHDAYNAEIDRANGEMAWGAADVNTWYRNDRGRIAQNWPHSLLEYWTRTRTPDPADYTFA